MARWTIDPPLHPNSRKVTPASNCGNGSKIISYPAKTTSPLAKGLLAVPGVVSLFFLNDFVTVTRQPGADWEPIIAAVQAAAGAHL